MEDSEVGLPKATVLKVMKEAAPPELRLGTEAVGLVCECCNEFVQLVSSEATEMCDTEKKQTIQPEHVFRALEALGFASMIPDAQKALDDWNGSNKGSQRVGKRKTKAEEAGLSEAEQIALQLKMFAEARAQSGFQEVPALES